ncbi:hypothetical protein Aau02nite_47670 [Amorphoplanes auranticolor]|uniref:Uncharacterized protein n=1 Tax=Actinoplanes auranticolor TaxID=47988 RepID=A0A919SHL3_9ACTN|nr:hypothetical protein Aau02nite_47670 [Actinoplanes auranticolor]
MSPDVRNWAGADPACFSERPPGPGHRRTDGRGVTVLGVAVWGARQVSDPLGEFGERRGDPQCRAGVDFEFVVAAAQILYDRAADFIGQPCPIIQSVHATEPRGETSTRY